MPTPGLLDGGALPSASSSMSSASDAVARLKPPPMVRLSLISRPSRSPRTRTFANSEPGSKRTFIGAAADACPQACPPHHLPPTPPCVPGGSSPVLVSSLLAPECFEKGTGISWTDG